VAGVARLYTIDNPAPSFTAAFHLSCVMRVFRPLPVVDVVAAVRALPDKQCMSDPLPTNLMKNNVDVLAPFLIELFSKSLAVKCCAVHLQITCHQC